MASIFAPTVVDHNTIGDGRLVEQPGKQFRRTPFGAGHFPFAVGEDDGGLYVLDNVFELREQVFRYVTRFIGKPKRVVPFVKRIVDPHVKTFAASSFGQI
jgi:hypothetical protein